MPHLHLDPVPDPALAAIPATTAPANPDFIERQLRDLVEDLAPDPTTPRGRGRPRILPALTLWCAVVVCVLKRGREQSGVWRRLTALGVWSFPLVALSDQAVYHRLARDGTAALEQLFAHISAALATRLAGVPGPPLAAFARAVYALDESTLDQVARRLPLLRAVPRGDARHLPGKLSALFDVRRQQFTRIAHQLSPKQNEKRAAREMVAGLEPGTLLLADLGYFGFRWFDDLTDQGLWWISRVKARTSYQVIHPFFDQGAIFDGLVWLGAHRADRAKHAVRLVRFRMGASEYAYFTNVRDPRVLPLGEIARLYARRWDIELAFRLVKQYLGLHLLWSSKAVVVLQQVWAVLILAQIIQAMRMEIALRAEVDPFEVSLPLLIRYAPLYAEQGRNVVDEFVTDGWRLGYLRASRRVKVEAPVIPPDALHPLPPDLVLARVPRYAEKGGIQR